MRTKGGMASVLASYAQYIEGMRFVPTWRLGNNLVKLGYAVQAWVRTWFLCKFDRHLEIVHIHGAAYASFDRSRLFIKLAKRYGQKVILHEHAADFVEYYRQTADKEKILETIRLCDRLIVLSKSWKAFFVSIGVEECKICVLNNIVSPPAWIDVPRPDDKLHLMYMGEISKRKGGFDLLQAMSEHKDYFKDKLLLRMGGNEVDGDVRSFIIGNGLSDFVTYEGWISGRQKVECLIWADVYILPSYNEGLPVAILEAMAYRHPVISTPVGGIPEVIRDGINGRLIRPGDAEAIAEAVRYYIEQDGRVKIQGEEAYKAVQDFFPESVFADLKAVYESVLNSEALYG